MINDDKSFKKRLARRNMYGSISAAFFFVANLIGLILIAALFLHIINQSMGYVVYVNRVEPETLSERPLEDLSEEELGQLILQNQPARIRVYIRDYLSRVSNDEFAEATVGAILRGREYPPEWENIPLRDLEHEQQLELLYRNMNQRQMLNLVVENIVQPTAAKSWRLFESLFNSDDIKQQAAEEFPNGDLKFHSWLNWDFLTRSVTSSATTTGLKTALLGSFWIISITAVTALILGVGAAIYLEEYASDNWLNRAIEINIRNLAAVPSVIYGMLGLAVFARALGEITSGAVFGVTDSNGRTVLSAALTLAILILPILIVNAQEALRAVPSSIREGSYGMGATRWQTVSRQVLPAALPGIMTGVILSMSRAIGETAPLLVVGASTFIGIDPNGPFSKFTVVPIQIYEWTNLPDQTFKSVAAAAIIAMLFVLLLLNAIAIILRNRYSRSF
ncbi:MAG: hypothetical protein Kow00117_20570 [Phototrophicales bacterium]